jgi:hypothetical protein
MDSVLLTLDHSSVSNVYSQGKSFFCCSLANQVYKQWVATITVIALAWVAMQCALRVLSKLDTLSGVYACVCVSVCLCLCGCVAVCLCLFLIRIQGSDQPHLLERSLGWAVSRTRPLACLRMVARARMGAGRYSQLTVACCCRALLICTCREVLPLQALPQQGLWTRQRSHH